MEKMALLRSLHRAAASCIRSSRYTAVTRHLSASRSIVTLSSPSKPSPPNCIPSDFRPPFATSLGSRRYFSEDITHTPDMKDLEIKMAFEELMATNWDELPNAVVYDVKQALSKNTDDKAGQEVLANVFRAAEAVEEFGGMVMSLKMELDDLIGVSGENVKPLSEDYASALNTIFQRYSAYLDAFGPDEVYLRKKVENELGSRLIYLKMRCGGLNAEWGKVTVLGTSGLAGSYIERRA